MNFSLDIKVNYKNMLKILKSDDIVFEKAKIQNRSCYLIFAKDLVNKNNIGKLILSPLNNYKGKMQKDEIFSSFLSPEKEMSLDVNVTINSQN